MTSARVSDKGQITLPAQVRRKLGIQPKSKVDVEVREGEIVIRPVQSISDLYGIFHEAAKGITADWETIRNEMERLVAEEVANEGRD